MASAHGVAGLSRVRLRTAVPADAAFLLRLYGSTRAAELALMPWSAVEKAAFVRMQFQAQDAHFRGHYPDAERWIVVVDGAPAGRLYVDHRADEVRVIDISLLPEHRGQGIGTALLRRVLGDAAAAGLPVRVHVVEGNPARRLYDRLGFRPVDHHGFHEAMEATP